MINGVTKKPLRVQNEGTAGPYLRLPEDQLEEVCLLLGRHEIENWVDEVRISWDGKPYNAVINFGRKGDAEAIQRILDGGR